MKKTILLNGIVIGEVEATGDYDRDAEAARKFMEERGLRKTVSRFQAMFNTALAFANTSAYLYERDLRRLPRNGGSIVPFVVNSAFAIELYFKALAQKHETSLRGHELVKLHKALPTKALREIDTVSSKCAADRKLEESPNFSKYVQELNNAFVEWRYMYEKDKAGPIRIEPTIFVMQVLHEACRL